MNRNRALLEAQAKLILERLNEFVELDAKFGEDDWPTGTVIAFDRVWEVNNKRYDFAALKVINNLWYVTKGDRSMMGSPFTWENLKEFMRTTTKFMVVKFLMRMIGMGVRYLQLMPL